MKRIGLLALAIVLSLGLLGVGFAQWTETLNIDGTANTGNVAAIFRDVVSNDDGAVDPWFCLDGVWIPNVDTGDDGSDPTAEQKMGLSVNRIANVANTAVAGAWIMSGTYDAPVMPPTPPTDLYKEITVSITNAYPSYHPTVFFNIINAGSIPCKVKTVWLVEVSKKGVVIDIDDVLLIPCETWYVHFTQDPQTGLPIGALVDKVKEGAHFSLHLSDDENHLYDTCLLVYPDWPGTASGNLDIHIEDGAEELVEYDFVIEIEVVAFNK